MKDHISSEITGGDLTAPLELTCTSDPVTPLNPGTYIVTATADTGYTLVSHTEWPYVVTIDPAFCPPTEGLVTPLVQCNSNGSYTFGEANGFDSEITWTVDGAPKAPGTYRVTTAGEHVIVGTPVGTSFEDGFANPYRQTLYFASANDCAQLPTLAFTGADSGTTNLGLLLTGGLLLLGGALMLLERRFRHSA
jgi:hypothetical protein